MTPGKNYRKWMDRFVRAAIGFAVCINGAVILGWTFDIPTLKSVLPGLVTMKVNTAVGGLAAAVALLLLYRSEPGSRPFRIARGLALFVVLLGALSLAEYLFTLDFGIDQLLFLDHGSLKTGATPGRMSPATALAFLLLGSALWVFRDRRPWAANWTHWLVVPVLFISVLGIIGYAYGVAVLYQVGNYNSMALNTALSFIILSFAVWAADTQYGFARIAGSDTAGGIVARRLLPALPLILLSLGWLCLAGQRRDLYYSEFGLALMVLMSIAVAWTANTLHDLDVVRQHRDAEISSLNAELEQRVQLRTAQLEHASTQLRSANAALEQLSRQDALTEIPNRRAFDANLAIHLAIAHRHGRPLALLLFDVDFFKPFNDQYGHPAGDDCLRHIAAALQSCCRRPYDMVARYGGEEFAMLLPDTDLGGARQTAELVEAAIRELRIPHVSPAPGSSVSISGGIAVLDPGGKLTAEQLMDIADRNLYQAKHDGRNRIVSGQAEAA
ncbi:MULTISPECIES: diguanylate cyclase [Rhodomicrobium]|uniref:GGDEF domain-containing protein n=1 Tax=Rhodomicrobium TaxID=1068 RepID=UPI000B4B0644|nr:MULTISPECIES: diguanylate cyclase [Rhodomicrobium]